MIFIKNNLNKKEKRQFEIFNALNKDYCKDFYYFDGKKRISIYRNEKLIYSLFNKGNLLIVFDYKFTGVILAFKYDKYYEIKCLGNIDIINKLFRSFLRNINKPCFIRLKDYNKLKEVLLANKFFIIRVFRNREILMKRGARNDRKSNNRDNQDGN